jgi:hypothetical protein
MNQPGEERRRSRRVTVDLPVRLTIGSASLPGRVRDICRDAALVEVHHECALGSVVALAFDLGDEGGAIQVTGDVIRIARGDGDARAVAVLFRDLQPQAEGRIEMFLNREQG